MPVAPKTSRTVFEKLDRNLVKLSSELRPQNVHGIRTGTRRLQILLGELSPKLNRNQKKLLKLLGRVRKRAGKLRDLDVQLAALRSLKIPREPRRKTQLMNELIELRRSQEKKLTKAADKNTIREIRKRLRRARKDFDPKATREPLAVAREMLEPVRLGNGEMTEALLHQYRILSKRARYAAEFGDQTPETRRFIAGVKRIQDALGDWHDWLTLTQTAGKHLGEVRESSLVAELHNVTGAKFRNAVSMLQPMRTEPGATKHPAKDSVRSSAETIPRMSSAA
jgi:CHAD domain-containing protein